MIDLDEAFALVERAAVTGARCPKNDEFGTATAGAGHALPALARLGRIKIEIYALNWRVVEIMQGPNRGKRTMARPNDDRPPWKVLHRGVTETNTSVSRRVAARRQPSAPRALGRHEL